MELAKIESSPNGDQRRILRQTELIRERLGSALRLFDQLTSEPAPAEPSMPVTEQAIRGLLKLRRNRERFFESEMFADPAWDILLELYAAHLGQQRMSVSSLCLGAAVPPTTALRWIGLLDRKGLIGRRPDPMDGRRVFVHLTGAGRDAMHRYFRTVPTGALLV